MVAPFLYIVKFWVGPDGAADLLHWLDDKHMAEVTAQPGFRWSRRVRLDQDADDGWHGYMMIYGLDFARGAAALFRERRAEAVRCRAQAVRAASAHRARVGSP